MDKKSGRLLWLDRNIKTKEDFQFLMVSIFIILIIFTKCYLSLSNNTGIPMEVQNQAQGVIRPYTSSGFLFTK